MSKPEPQNVEIRLDGVNMTFRGGHRAVADLSFGVERGEFVAVVGPSGCGKSTLLRILAGLLAPSAGTLTVMGRPWAEVRGRCRVGFVFQDPRLLPWRTASENAALPLELARLPRPTRESRVADAFALVGLTPADAAKTPRMLSGGMRMRVSLARALVTRPDMLLLDEPFGALDDILRQQLNEELVRIWMQQRPTAVFVTHNVAEAVYLSQRVLVVTPAPGRIAADVRIPFDYPRASELRATAEFARCAGDVSARLRAAAS
jgi:NitT/TauT family transport system ATP-binding protein